MLGQPRATRRTRLMEAIFAPRQGAAAGEENGETTAQRETTTRGPMCPPRHALPFVAPSDTKRTERRATRPDRDEESEHARRDAPQVGRMRSAARAAAAAAETTCLGRHGT